jgi:hypothetical protein
VSGVQDNEYEQRVIGDRWLELRIVVEIPNARSMQTVKVTGHLARTATCKFVLGFARGIAFRHSIPELGEAMQHLWGIVQHEAGLCDCENKDDGQHHH